jgi:hypothetical protein
MWDHAVGFGRPLDGFGLERPLDGFGLERPLAITPSVDLDGPERGLHGLSS